MNPRIIAEIRKLLDNAKIELRNESAKKYSYIMPIEHFLHNECERELATLEKMLMQPVTFASNLRARCIARSHDDENSVSYKYLSDTPANRLYWALVSLVSRRKNMHKMLAFMQPDIRYQITLHPDGTPTVQDLSLRELPVNLDSLSDYVMTADTILDSRQMTALGYDQQVRARKLLQQDFPDMHRRMIEQQSLQQVYTRNKCDEGTPEASFRIQQAVLPEVFSEYMLTYTSDDPVYWLRTIPHSFYDSLIQRISGDQLFSSLNRNHYTSLYQKQRCALALAIARHHLTRKHLNCFLQLLMAPAHSYILRQVLNELSESERLTLLSGYQDIYGQNILFYCQTEEQVRLVMDILPELTGYQLMLKIIPYDKAIRFYTGDKSFDPRQTLITYIRNDDLFIRIVIGYATNYLATVINSCQLISPSCALRLVKAVKSHYGALLLQHPQGDWIMELDDYQIFTEVIANPESDEALLDYLLTPNEGGDTFLRTSANAEIRSFIISKAITAKRYDVFSHRGDDGVSPMERLDISDAEFETMLRAIPEDQRHTEIIRLELPHRYANCSSRLSIIYHAMPDNKQTIVFHNFMHEICHYDEASIKTMLDRLPKEDRPHLVYKLLVRYTNQTNNFFKVISAVAPTERLAAIRDWLPEHPYGNCHIGLWNMNEVLQLISLLPVTERVDLLNYRFLCQQTFLDFQLCMKLSTYVTTFIARTLELLSEEAAFALIFSPVAHESLLQRYTRNTSLANHGCNVISVQSFDTWYKTYRLKSNIPGSDFIMDFLTIISFLQNEYNCYIAHTGYLYRAFHSSDAGKLLTQIQQCQTVEDCKQTLLIYLQQPESMYGRKILNALMSSNSNGTCENKAEAIAIRWRAVNTLLWFGEAPGGSLFGKRA